MQEWGSNYRVLQDGSHIFYQNCATAPMFYPALCYCRTHTFLRMYSGASSVRVRDNHLFPNILVDRQQRAKMRAFRFNFTFAIGMKSDTRGSSFSFIYGIPRYTVNDVELTSRDRKTCVMRCIIWAMLVSFA